MKIRDLLSKYPFVDNYFKNNFLDTDGKEDLTFREYLDSLPEELIEDKAIDKEILIQNLDQFIAQMLAFLGEEEIRSISILPGIDKDGEAEKFDEIILRKSDIISIVGPTGSGKSRLLADIEYMAQRDTPTKRKILINGKEPDYSRRFSPQKKLVSQLSQNMNFVMDLTVKEFLTLHAKARLINIDEKLDKIIEDANNLSGEKFSPDRNLTQLSGGQSRALMISDTANLSKSPIVLIDEIENAGIDRNKAIDLLISEEKIVLMATHDPMLALKADKRIIIKNGAIDQILYTDEQEVKLLNELSKIDLYLNRLRNDLRMGKSLKSSLDCTKT